MAPMPITDKQKFWAAVIAGGAVVLFLVHAAVSDLAARMRRHTQEIRVAEAELKKALVVQQAADRIAADYAQYAPFLQAGNAPSLQLLEEMLREVERIARDASVSIVNLMPQNVTGTEGAREYRADLRIECQGTDRLLSFLNGIQASKFLIKIVKFNVAAKDEQGAVLKAEMVLSLLTDPE